MEAKLIKDRTVRTITTTIGPTGETATTDTTERTVTLALDGAEIIETGYERMRRYRPEELVIRFAHGRMTEFHTSGTFVRRDGSAGTKRESDDFSPDGTRLYFRNRGPAPAEIMAIVEAYR